MQKYDGNLVSDVDICRVSYTIQVLPRLYPWADKACVCDKYISDLLILKRNCRVLSSRHSLVAITNDKRTFMSHIRSCLDDHPRTDDPKIAAGHQNLRIAFYNMKRMIA